MYKGGRHNPQVLLSIFKKIWGLCSSIWTSVKHNLLVGIVLFVSRENSGRLSPGAQHRVVYRKLYRRFPGDLQEIAKQVDTKVSVSFEQGYILSQWKTKETENALQPFIRFSMNTSLI